MAEEMAAMEMQKADLAMKSEALETATAGTLDTQEKLDAAAAAHAALIASIAAATAVADTAMYQAQADAANAAIAAARKVVDAQAEKDRLAMEAAEAERMAAEQAAMNALARALKAGIDTDLIRGRVESTVTTEGRPYLNPTTNVLGIQPTVGVRDNALPGTIEHTQLKLDASTTVAALGGWQGAQYVRTDSDGMRTDTAVIYTNQGLPKRELFATKHAGIIANTGEVPNASLAGLMPMSSAFRTTPGTKTHTLPSGVTSDYIVHRGTLDGAPGQFRCGSTATTCTSAGGPNGTTILGAGWYFIADANAMTSTPDTAYSGFGWWLEEDGDNKRADGFWFVSRPAGGADIDSVDGTLIDDDADAITAVQNLRGTATYSGHAAGKVGFHDPVLSSRNIGGHFTADVTLTADFQGFADDGSTESWGTMTGTLDDFMVNGVAANDWEVKLLSNRDSNRPSGFRESNISGFPAQPEEGVIYSGATTWSIDGKLANDQGGSHAGVLLDAHEDSGLPLTTVGQFTAKYGDIGSMTGGFGATTSDPDE